MVRLGVRMRCPAEPDVPAEPADERIRPFRVSRRRSAGSHDAEQLRVRRRRQPPVRRRAALRADYVFRDFRDFYVARTDPSDGKVTNSARADVRPDAHRELERYNRRYQGLTTQGTYRFDAPHRRRRHLHAFADTGATSMARPWPADRSPAEPLNIPSTSRMRGTIRTATWPMTSAIVHGSGSTTAFRGRWSDAQPASGARERRPVRRRSTTSGVNQRHRSLALRHQSRLSDSAFRRTQDHLLLTRPRDEFRLEGQRRTDFAANYNLQRVAGGRTRRPVRPRAGPQPVQPVPAVRLRRAPCSTNGGGVAGTDIDQTIQNAR